MSSLEGVADSDVFKLLRFPDKDSVNLMTEVYQTIDLEKERLLNEYSEFISSTTVLTKLAKEGYTIEKIQNLLFEKKFKDQHINDELKKIMAVLKIQKKVSFHVARHTFATSFLRAGGQVEKLQRLLGHSDIKQTMIYAHIVQADANAEIFLFDTLF